MSKLALKIVEAIQHSLLGSLLVVLVWPTLWLFGEADRIGGEHHLDWFLMSAGGLLLLLVFFAWLLGAIARGAQRPVSAMDRIHKEAANGFDVWTCTPEGGLRPSAPMRWLVTFLARKSGRKPHIAGLIPFIGGLVFFFLLAGLGDETWDRAHPWFGDAENRRLIAFVLAFLFAAWFLRQWATRQRANLAPLP